MPDQSGHRYFLTLVDDCTRFTWLYLLKQKSNVSHVIPRFFNMISTQFNMKIKVFRSENAKELLFHDFFLADMGVIHQFSCVECPQQNSVAERKHQHLLNVARALYFQSRVPLHFWSHCVLTATFLINHIPSPLLNSLKQFMHSQFKLKDLGSLKFFLGLEIARAASGIVLSQHHYVLQLLENTGFLGCKPAQLPMDPKVHLTASDGTLLTDPSQYRRLIGRLLYLTLSRPNITFVVHKLSEFVAQSRDSHIQVAHHLRRYLKHSPSQGLLFSANSTLQLKAFSNADWGSCSDSRRSTTWFCVFLGYSLVSWKSKK